MSLPSWTASTSRYLVYGVVIETAFDFGFPLPAADAQADVLFVGTDGPPDGVVLHGRPPLYEEPPPTDERPSDFRYHHVRGWDVLQVRDVADYYLRCREIRVHLHDPDWASIIPVHLFGMVIALWLERQGVVCLHGSAVAIDGGTVVFLGPKGTGKSSLAAHCTARGDALLTDDLVALDMVAGRITARPGYPEIRMWPQQVERYVGPGTSFPRVRPDVAKVRVPVGEGGIGSMAPESLAVRRVYLPTRDGRRHVLVAPMPSTAAFAELLRHSFLPMEVQRLGLQAGRLPVLAGLLKQASCATVHVPEGLERLEDVRRAVEADVRNRPR